MPLFDLTDVLQIEKVVVAGAVFACYYRGGPKMRYVELPGDDRIASYSLQDTGFSVEMELVPLEDLPPVALPASLPSVAPLQLLEEIARLQRENANLQAQLSEALCMLGEGEEESWRSWH